MKYDVKYSCSHTGTVYLVGKTKEREYKIKWYEESGLCPECYEKKRTEERLKEEALKQEANERAAALAEAQNLPELSGSDKQVAWANTIRQSFIDKFKPIKIEGAVIVSHILKNITLASDWIEARDNLAEFVIRAQDELKRDVDDGIKRDVEAEATVLPADKNHDGVVIINKDNTTINVFYPKNDVFYEIIKSKGYRWNKVKSCWSRTIVPRRGTVADRMAELGNEMLNNGFSVRLYDEETRRKAIEGDYKPECTRWILLRTSGRYAGWLVIKWEEQNEELYDKARGIKGSRWDESVIVSKEYYEQIEDFADLMGFQFSAAAREAIDTYKESTVGAVGLKSKEKEVTPDKLAEILRSDRGVIDDLKD